jgi:hypothetical protein
MSATEAQVERLLAMKDELLSIDEEIDTSRLRISTACGSVSQNSSRRSSASRPRWTPGRRAAMPDETDPRAAAGEFRRPAPGYRLDCVGCGAVSHFGISWRAFLTVDDEVATYCPECAEAEFDG